jgi:hypothetical protein
MTAIALTMADFNLLQQTMEYLSSSAVSPLRPCSPPEIHNDLHFFPVSWGSFSGARIDVHASWTPAQGIP